MCWAGRGRVGGQGHVGAIGRKTLHEQRHAAIVKQPGQASLIGVDVAHADALLGNQHGQLRDIV